MSKKSISPSQVKKITGAKHHEHFDVAFYYAPPFLDNLRDWIKSKLLSRGGRPTIQGSDVVRKVRFSKKNWKNLELIAKSWSKTGVSISPSQVATSILDKVISEVKSAAKSS